MNLSTIRANVHDVTQGTVERSYHVAQRGSEGSYVPQRPELAVVVPISTEASREASVGVSCGCFWPFLGPLCVTCFLCQL